MMSAPGVLLSRPRSEQYSSLMAQGLSKMRRDRENTDFALVAEDDKSVPCHKIIMSIYSPYIRKLLRTDMAEAAKKQMNMDFKLDVVKSIVDYIYTGEISVQSDELIPTIKACHLLGVKEMKQWSVEQVTSVLEPGNVIAWREMANKYKLPQLQSQCSTMMLHQFLTIVQQNTFLAMTYDQVHQYLAEVHAYLTGVHVKATEVHENATEVHENATGVLENAMEMQENPEDVPENLRDVPEDAATAEGADFVQDDVLSAVMRWINDNTEARRDHMEALLQQVELNKCSLSTLLDLMESHGALIGPNPNVFRHVTRALKEITDQQTESASTNNSVATQTYPQDNKMMNDITEVDDEKREPASTRPKINCNIPIHASTEIKEEKEEIVPVSWEDETNETNEGWEQPTNESWVQPTNESIAAAASNESWVKFEKDNVKGYNKSGELPKDHKKISMSFNSKAEKPFNKPRVSESSSKDEDEKSKDGLTKNQRKNQKRAMKGAQGGPVFYPNASYPPGHPLYEAAKEAREAKEAEEKQQRHRQYQASYPPGHPLYEAAKEAREPKEAEEKQQRHRQYQAGTWEEF